MQESLMYGKPNVYAMVLRLPTIHRFRTVAQHIPWIRPLVPWLPSSFLSADTAFRQFAATQAKARAQTEPVNKDLFYHLVCQLTSSAQ